jgi:hypothetical protein
MTTHDLLQKLRHFDPDLSLISHRTTNFTHEVRVVLTKSVPVIDVVDFVPPSGNLVLDDRTLIIRWIRDAQ